MVFGQFAFYGLAAMDLVIPTGNAIKRLPLPPNDRIVSCRYRSGRFRVLCSPAPAMDRDPGTPAGLTSTHAIVVFSPLCLLDRIVSGTSLSKPWELALIRRRRLGIRKTPGWDSVAHMRLVAEIESAFDIMMDTEDVIG